MHTQTHALSRALSPRPLPPTNLIMKTSSSTLSLHFHLPLDVRVIIFAAAIDQHVAHVHVQASALYSISVDVKSCNLRRLKRVSVCESASVCWLRARETHAFNGCKLTQPHVAQWRASSRVRWFAHRLETVDNAATHSSVRGCVLSLPC